MKSYTITDRLIDDDETSNLITDAFCIGGNVMWQGEEKDKGHHQ